MKVIKEGAKKENEYEVECSKCDSVLHYTNGDRHSDQRDGDYIICPVCKAFIAFSVGRLISLNPFKKQ